MSRIGFALLFIAAFAMQGRALARRAAINAPMKSKTIVFIHGLFQNPKSWEAWEAFFTKAGYKCYAPAYPYHEGEPAQLRAHPDPRLKTLTYMQVVDYLSAFIDSLPEKPILIGHSIGGQMVQKLLAMGKAEAAIAVNPAPSKGLMTFTWSFYRANMPTVNPMAGNSIFMPSVDWFHYAFCNTMTLEETRAAYEAYFVPESRNIPRTSRSEEAAVDFTKSHPPLLIIAGEKDHIIPASLNKKNYEAYKDTGSVTDFKEFPGRTHYICTQQGWEEVAAYVKNWIEAN
jgi:pimeloyl-ACP methyl ester carboxylesterase